MVLVTAISGLLIAHTNSVNPRAERPLRVTGSGSIKDAMPIYDLLIAALKAVQDRHLWVTTPEGNLARPRGPAAIERALFRPANGTVQVLLRDPQPLEVVLDWKTAQVLSVAPRHEYRWLRLHAAEDVLGEDGTFKRDAIAGLILVMSLTGIGIWFRDRARLDLDRPARVHRRLGLVAGLVLMVPAVTGVLMNHRADLGFTYRPTRELEAEDIVKRTPASLSAIVDAATTFVVAGGPATAASGVDWLDYVPRTGYVTVGFHDGTDVFVSVYDTEVRAIMPPRDRWVRQLHSGRLFGVAGWMFRDLTALLWIAVTFGGLYRMVSTWRRERSPS